MVTNLNEYSIKLCIKIKLFKKNLWKTKSAARHEEIFVSKLLFPILFNGILFVSLLEDDKQFFVESF